MDDHGLTNGSPAPWVATGGVVVADRMRRWLASPALTELLAAFDGPSTSDLDRLVEWTTAVFDTRHGGERQEAPPASFTPPQVAALLAAAGPLGLLSTLEPTGERFDLTVVLGGTVTANLLRVTFAAELAAAGFGLGRVVGATAARLLTSEERVVAGVDTEAEHLAAVLLQTFPTHEVDARPAPSSRPGRRADTADCVQFVAQEPTLRAGDRVLVVTSAIYVSYQFAAAAPILLANGACRVEFVGTPTAVGRPESLAQRIAQEVHATAWSMR